MGEVFKLNHCYNMDCLPAMELFPDNYFDLAVVDPPYFSGPERRGFYGSKVSKIGVHRDYPVSPAWSKPEPEYFKELFRVCRHYIVWGCNYFDYQFSTGRIVWDKCNGNSSFSDCEIAATNLFSSVRMFRYMWSGMMQGKSITEGDTMQGNKSLNEKRIHPTQKPVALYDWIFKNYAEPGQKILDTHLGSGSSRIAAYEAGLGFIGFEIDPFYFQRISLPGLEHCWKTRRPGWRKIWAILGSNQNHHRNAGCNKWQISALCDLGKCARCTFVKWREGF